MGGYQALYRQWRPRRFADVVGQEHVTRSLRHAVAQGRVAHAYLFCGPRGTGKTSVARILAQALLCERPEDGEPCGACGNCQRFGQDGALDVMEIDAASNRGIDEIRDLRERLGYAPSGGRYKVYIVDEVHMLTEPAFNALLKTLEEPPAFVVFVLATTEPRKVPATIASRCQRFDFRRFTTEQIRGQLEKIVAALGAEAEPEALEAIASRADGGLRDALSLLDQCLVYADGRLTDDDVAAVLGTASREELERLADAIERRDAAAVWDVASRLYEEGRDLAQVVRDLIDVWQARARGRMGADARRSVEVLEGLLDLEGELRRGASPRVTVEVGLVRLAWDEDPPAATAPRPSPGAASRASTPAPRSEPEPKPQAAPPPAPSPAPLPQPGPEPKPQGASHRSPAPSRAEHTPRPEAAAPAQVQDVSLDSVVARWDDVMKAVRKLKVGTHALLAVAKPGALNGGELILHFAQGYTFHKDQIARDEHRVVVERALRSVLGVELRVRCVTEEAAAPPDPASAGAAASGAAGEPSSGGPEDDPLVRAVLDRFGGEIVEVREMND